MNRQMHLGALLFSSGHHGAAWKRPGTTIDQVGQIEYFEKLGQLAERGKFDTIFLADGQSIMGGYYGGVSYFLEPITCLTAIAAKTKHIGLVPTVSSTLYDPYNLARLICSLDHVSHGRAGVNIVTSMFDAEAQNHGMEKLPNHADRYGRADEFIQTMIELWDSFPLESIIDDFSNNAWLDRTMIHPINHDGKYFKVRGPLNIPSSPQGRPVLMQSGLSEQGRNLGAKYAEAIYSVAWDLKEAQSYYQDMKNRAHQLSRNRGIPVIMPGLVPYVGSTHEEAVRKQRELDELLPLDESVAQLGAFLNVDVTSWDLDAPVPELPSVAEFAGPKGRFEVIKRIVDTEHPTVRQLFQRLAAGGGHATVVGAPEEIADMMQDWFENGGADGFNLMEPTYPESLTDFVDQVVPVLQKRGIFRTEYSGTTLRDNFGLGAPQKYDFKE
ncbi:LLM class flavin-dependent oxidoreductase [Lactobacillus sp. Sy-1]|uniref:LLM class flavin-dependent oxidoreductase n=1 Tax=Lactobacillus sp. Sy-1 TaxID=2109645 RepID=UPI001C5A5A3E|nr:LLM class flavin-dependent oxidoreductase [Lactobacillus sp. Sy-1]MBW1604930.1 LLM class flavin-dependent oxidoreductase [Lactobacillus sp. Sy-1]